ncbi:amino acid adenylation domain-containing protein [Streptomyces zhaozhouensis]|uniref:Amino acid adenylation domain-containing protein n=1 Tax=Streptomyces zhaozhouensis TaxID=1300267 RepID=A0A286DLF7_9ACTN|nr:non-ribosomal peptide synthetase [Streptomyces zhaozhouensis]SOD59518.1 amino acid adenylation domain-containing protein [Streptomyces zhaozhouensis]
MTDDLFDCSLLQRRLWFVDRLNPGDAAYNISLGSRIRGPLDAELLEASLDAVVARHGALRTCFVEVGGEPRQRVLPGARVPLVRTDLTREAAHDPAAAERRALALAAEENHAPFDLSRAPLLRARLIRLGPEDHLLTLTVHHIVFDGWSAGILLDDLSRAYRDDARLPPPPAQFTDLVAWERSTLHRDERERLLSWWRERLDGAPTVLDLVTDRPRPAVQAHRGARHTLRLPEETAEAVEALGRVYQVTPFLTLLAAFGTVLARHADQDELLLGTPVAARPDTRFEEAVGLFLNTVLIRYDATGDPTFAQLLSRVRGTALDAFEHQQVPFESLVNELDREHSLSRNPLCQVFVNAEPEPSPLTLAGCAVEPLTNEQLSAKFDLTLYVRTREGGLELELVYDADLFTADRAAELLDQTGLLLAQIGRNPHLPVREYTLVTERCREGLPDPTRPIERRWAGSVLDRLARHRAATPDRTVLSAPGRDWTFAELDADADRLADRLLAAGVRRGDVVGLLTTRDPSTAIGMFAALKIGAPFVIMDSTLPAGRLEQCVAVSEPRALVVCAGPEALPPEAPPPGAGDIPVVRLDDPAWRAGDAGQPHAPALGPEEPVYAVFTSGTTGLPKCVRTTHGTLSHFFEWYEESQELGTADRFAVLSGLGYEPLMRDILMAVWAGASCHFPAHDRLEFAAIGQWLSDARITVAHLTPPYAEELATVLKPLPEMRLVGVGGDVLRRGTAVAWAALAPEARLLNYYGTTETPQAISVLSLRDRATEDGVRAFGNKLPIGPGIEGVELLCVNSAWQLCGVGEIGEVMVRTPYLARYVGQDRGGFLTSPWTEDPEDRIYRTGDRARWLGDGCLEFIGRTDHQVNLRGFRIEPGDVEAVLTRHPAVGQALVVVREDPHGDRRLVAYVTAPAGDEAPTARELRALVAESLPRHMEPAAFVVLDAFPLTVNGKIDRRALPAPVFGAAGSSRPAGTATERALAALWAEVLGVEDVGAEDDFFDLGGHSLLLARLLARVREELGASLALREVFERPTVAGWAELVEERAGEKAGPAAPDEDEGRYGEGEFALTSLQRRLWFLDRLHPGDTAYHMTVTARLRGRPDLGLLEDALNAVVARHGALRTHFVEVEGEPRQRVAAQVRVPLRRAAAGTEREALALAAEESRLPFDLGHGPLLRALLVEIAPGDQLLSLTVHHIVFDGWSAGILLGDLSAAYAHGARLDEAPARLTDLVAWERTALAQREEGLLSWWRERLDGAPTVLDLVTDRPRPAVQAHRGARHTLTLPEETAEAVEALGRAHGVTPFMTLLAAFGTVLARQADQDELLLGTPVAARPHSRFEEAVGLFLNTVLIRYDATGDPTFAQLLSRVRATALDAFEHQDVPFERLVTALAPAPDLSRNPLFQVLFSFQNTPRTALRLGDVDVELLDGSEARAQGDLCLRLARRERGVTGVLDYDSELFTPATAERLVRQFRTLLDAVTRRPDVPLSALPLAGPEERRTVLTDWQGPARDWTTATTLPGLLAEQAARTPAAEAVALGERRLTYAELHGRADALARRLRDHGVRPGTVVGVCLDRSPELVVALLAVLKAGGAYLPLEPELPRARLREMLADSAAPVVLAGPGRGTALGGAGRVVLAVTEETAPGGPEPLAGPDDLAYVLYTSGSTGAPKGVMVPHRGVVNRLCWMRDAYGLDGADRVLQKTPIGFDVSVWELFLPLISGGCLVLAEPGRHRDPDHLVEVIARERVTVCHFVPTMLGAFLDAPGVETLGSLRLVVCSGEELPAELARRARKTWDARLENLYGPTEASVDVTSWSVDGDDLWRVPIGAPLANVRAYVLDRRLAPVPVGAVGELYLGGVALARGYLGQPGRTAERFVADPFGPPGSRLYRTGDRARWLDGGALEFLGRTDHQVKLRGFRIEPGEIEAVLARHPAVGQALVAVREDGRGDRRLVAYVTATPGEGAPTARELRALVAESLPRHMEPAAFVVLDAFPLTVNGKIDRRALPAPVFGAAGSSRPAGTATERALAALWAEVLGVEDVGAEDDFFALGGDSMHAVAVVGRARARGLTLSVDALFRTPTVAALAEAHEERAHAGGAPAADQPPSDVGAFGLMTPEDRARLGLGRGPE